MDRAVRLLVVDDSAFARLSVSRHFQSDPSVQVVGIARDGMEAIERVKTLQPDVVTLDVEMPRLDGLSALEQIMGERPTRVVMVSSQTAEGSEATIRALELGAVDFLCKPSRAHPGATSAFSAALKEKVLLAATVDMDRLKTGRSVVARAAPQKETAKPHRAATRLVVVGCSTGGPKALHALIPALPGDISFPVLVVQHMPAGFTRSMAERLDAESNVRVREARDGDSIRPGQVLLAPGDYHMRVAVSGAIRLDQGPEECGVRPAANVTMESAAEYGGSGAVGVVLTGMGSDGTRGAGRIKEAGGLVIAEDEETAIVYGMPRSVVNAGYADVVLPLHMVAGELAALSK